MGSVLTVDLTKNPDVAALVADMEPGSKIYGCFTIKDRDDQTLNMRLSKMAPTCDELKASEADKDDDEEEEGEGGNAQSPEGAEAEAPKVEEPVARKLARQMETNAPDGY